MNLEHAEVAASPHRLDQDDTSLHRGWLMLARAGWIALTLLILLLSAIAVPRAEALFQSLCQPGAHCVRGQLSLDDLRLLHQLGLSPIFLATYQVCLDGGTLLIYTGLATFIFWQRSRDRMALFCAYCMVLTGGATYTGLLDAGLRGTSPAWFWLVGALDLLGQVGFAVFFLLFPSGRFVPRWSRWIVPLVILNQIWYVFFVSVSVPGYSTLNGLAFAVQILALVGIQVYRYRRVSTATERQQTKWVVFAFSVAIVGFVLLIMIGNFVIPPQAQNSWVLNVLVLQTVSRILLLLIPISIAASILRYRLWDIDLIINRTLVYGTLTASIVSIYVLAVGYLGALFRTGSNLLVSLVAAGLVAVLFQPLKELLQRGANRLLYGQRDEPYTVITRLSRRLEATLTFDAVLPTIVETVAQALKLPYAAILLNQGDEFGTVASYGDTKGESLAFPLTYQGETIGKLLLALRAPGEDFTSADRRLLNELVRQVSLAAHTVRLTADLQRSNAHLQVARTHLVTAREEERRRLRRDLHDGLGPTLAALNLQAGAVQALIPQDPQQATAQVKEWRATLRAVIADIRRLVYDLRPLALDELGLLGSLREQAAQFSTQDCMSGTHMVIEAPDRLPPLPAAIEVAVYRISVEALTNVARHAQAHTCSLRLWLDDALHLEITDDGIGLPQEHRVGVGLLSMRERAEELGGSCTIDPVLPQGTRVSVRLPLPKE